MHTCIAGTVYDDLWALDLDNEGMGKLEGLAMQQVQGPGGARRAISEGQIPLSFLVPQLGGAARDQERYVSEK